MPFIEQAEALAEEAGATMPAAGGSATKGTPAASPETASPRPVDITDKISPPRQCAPVPHRALAPSCRAGAVLPGWRVLAGAGG
ncbi:MAG TPA: hypothetical protein VGG16_23110 [Streptosporangiaceae bacterium]